MMQSKYCQMHFLNLCKNQSLSKNSFVLEVKISIFIQLRTKKNISFFKVRICSQYVVKALKSTHQKTVLTYMLVTDIILFLKRR